MASVFSLSRLLSQRRETRQRYFEFLPVPALVPHRFHSIEEELEVLVLFAPAESRPAPV